MRWSLPEVLAVAMLAALALLFPPWLDPGAAGAMSEVGDGSALDPPRLVLEHRVGQLLVSGMTRSAAHEANLLRLAKEQFADSEIGTDLRPGVLFPDYWEAASSRLLHALAATESGVAVLESGAARIRAVTSDPAGLASRLAALRAELPTDTRVVEDVAVVGQTASLDELCRTNFANAVTERVAFRQSSAELRTSAYAVLDKLIDLANDCRANRIAIIGHTDATGNESWNLALSLARAQAVADYLVRGGIQPQRLIVEGVGSAEPVAANDTPYGRRQNRRIEFELR
jgi:OOP family OmpA-OmpF porin